MPQDKLTYSVEEAADAIGVSRSKCFELIKFDLLDSFKIGTRRLISVDAVPEYIERQRSAAKAERQAQRAVRGI
jgi:excisionase family DNA binding protein